MAATLALAQRHGRIASSTCAHVITHEYAHAYARTYARYEVRLVHNMTHCNALRRVASMRHIVNMLGYELLTRRTATHRNSRLD